MKFKIQSMHDHLHHSHRSHVLLREPYILTGYRPTNQPYSFYIKSLFNKHNETINAWSHYLGAIYCLYLALTIDFSDPYSWPILSSLIGTITLLFTSATAHLMHSKSHACHVTCYLFDYAGVAFFGFNAAIMQNFTSSPLWYYRIIEPYLLPLSGFFSLLISVGISVSITKYKRPYPPIKLYKTTFLQIGSCGLIWAFGQFSTIMCLFDNTNEVKINFTYHLIHTVSNLMGALFFGTHFPQSLMPGYFDFIGHSHNLFHLCVFVFVLFQHKACYWDYLTNREIIVMSRQPPTFLFSFASLLIVLVYHGFVIFMFKRMIAHNFDGEGNLKDDDDDKIVRKAID